MLNFNLIIVTTDLSENSLRALPYAAGLAERFDADLHVVSVVEPLLQVSDVAWVSPEIAGNEEERAADLKASIETIIRDQLPDGVRAEPVVLTGNPVDRIVKHAGETNADLIVSCTHGRGGISHMLMGSTAEALVRRSPCPVMTLKQPMPVSAVQRGS
jgi:nucleotide-binding universal stress UspA family protein